MNLVLNDPAREENLPVDQPLISGLGEWRPLELQSLLRTNGPRLGLHSQVLK
jgi:hypothetical protein